eukprot:5747549-Amphidinium_carterae.1
MNFGESISGHLGDFRMHSRGLEGVPALLSQPVRACSLAFIPSHPTATFPASCYGKHEPSSRGCWTRHKDVWQGHEWVCLRYGWSYSPPW